MQFDFMFPSMMKRCCHVLFTLYRLQPHLQEVHVATTSKLQMCMCRAYLEHGDTCMDTARFRRAETADMRAPGSVSVCKDSKTSCCLAGEDDASIVFESEVRETARRCNFICPRCRSLQSCSARLTVNRALMAQGAFIIFALLLQKLLLAQAA